MNREEIIDNFKKNTLYQLINLKIEVYNQGYIKLRLKIDDKLLNVNGSLHGGIYSVLLDTQMGMALRLKTENNSATINLNVSFLKAVKKGMLRSDVKFLSLGKSTAVLKGTLRDGMMNSLQNGIGTFRVFN